VSGQQILSGPLTVLANAGTHTVPLPCPSGMAPTGGGYRIHSGSIEVVGSYPEGDRWNLEIRGTAGGEVRAYVICIPNR
jgi:hypothetical protein